MIITIIIILIIGLSTIVYILPLQDEIPMEMVMKAKEIDAQSRNKEELIKNTYMFINKSYTSPVRQYLKEPSKVFIKSTTAVWNAQGTYMPSNTQNNMAKKMLLFTNKFKEEDFRTKQLFCEISPHDALFVKANNKEYVLDLWFADNNGEFNCYTQNPCGKKKICL